MSDSCVRQLERCDAAYSAYKPRQALAGTAAPSAEARVALRAAIKAVLQAKPHCPLELGRKVKVACIVGIHARIKRKCPNPEPYAANLYDHYWTKLSAIEPWYLAMAAGYRHSLDDFEFCVRGGKFVVEPGLIAELLEFAGPAWQAEIAADVMRLNARAGEGCE